MPMTIGQLAAGAGVNVQTIRYYERRGLIPEPARTAAGYRQYGGETASRLRFIKRAQELGFSLAEVQELLALRVRRASACRSVESRTRQKIALVEEKIHELEQMKAGLQRLVDACHARETTSDCPILEAIEEGV